MMTTESQLEQGVGMEPKLITTEPKMGKIVTEEPKMEKMAAMDHKFDRVILTEFQQVITSEPKSITMTPERHLSSQTELIYQLDPEPVFDYLLLHRALDQSTVDVIKSEEKLSERNVKLLRHLEELGNPAIELFINALRQSGQMYLASTLDVEHRIRPVHGTGYWEKQRYRGQVTISFRLVAAQVLVRKDSEEDNSPRIVDINAMLTPFKAKHSYENMTLIGDSGNGPRPRKILEYSYEEEEDDSCCWCCLPFLCCSTKSKKKKMKEREQKCAEMSKLNGADKDKTGSNLSLNLCDVMVSLPSQPSSPIKSGSTFFKTRKLTPTAEDTEGGSRLHKSSSVDRNSNHQLSEVIANNLPDQDIDNTVVKFDNGTEGVEVSSKKADKVKGKTKKSKTRESLVEINNQKNDSDKVGEDINGHIENKENDNPSPSGNSMKKEKSKGKSKKDSSTKNSPPNTLDTKSSPTGMKRSETYELVERWKSDGKAYENARSQFFALFDSAMQGRIVRYFEQERSTLVLQVGVEEGMTICTICMTTKQVKKLREDYEMGLIHEDLVRCVDPQKAIDKMECCAIHLRTVIDDDDIAMSFQELS